MNELVANMTPLPQLLWYTEDPRIDRDYIKRCYDSEREAASHVLPGEPVYCQITLRLEEAGTGQPYFDVTYFDWAPFFTVIPRVNRPGLEPTAYYDKGVYGPPFPIVCDDIQASTELEAIRLACGVWYSKGFEDAPDPYGDRVTHWSSVQSKKE